MEQEQEQELHALLPNWEWTRSGSVDWKDVMPPPRKQLSDVVPPESGGTCAAHTFAEALTANLRIYSQNSTLEVNLPQLLRLLWAKGFIRASGSSVQVIGQEFAPKYGIPIQGDLPDSIAADADAADADIDDADADAADRDSTEIKDKTEDNDFFVLGTKVHSFAATPLPFSDPTPEQVKAAMVYREHICTCLDQGPVVLNMELHDDFGDAREEGEPYRRPNNRTSPVERYHCITAYGYDCPDGTVRTLRLKYQENMIGAPGEEPQRGLYIDPDAIQRYYFVSVNGMCMSRTPAEGYQSVHMLPPTPPPPPSMWERIRRLF